MRFHGIAAFAIIAMFAAAASGQNAKSQAMMARSAPRSALKVFDPDDGPFIGDSGVVQALDRLDPSGECARSGPLVFGCLVQALASAKAHEPQIGALANPFNLKVARPILKTIQTDLEGVRADEGVAREQQIHPEFLEHGNSRAELVGIVNRIDRQFIHDKVPGAEDHNRCGEISLIYRFSYRLGEEDFSRLPVTMNVVFPAVPRAKPPGAADCQQVAERWLKAVASAKGQPVQQALAVLTDPETGVVSLLDGRDIERIELNIQAYRVKAGSDTRDLGSTAEYLIRVFRWNPIQEAFTPSYLTNQIDRARILGKAKGDANSCDYGVPRQISKADFKAWLLKPEVLSDIDTGTLNIPDTYLACRAVSVSPGGPARSGNGPFWNGPSADQQILSDADITQALDRARSPRRQFSFVKSADDFRLRLNELSCSGCHQTRAIAGFHFPGEDRAGTPVSNAVRLAGSPHFYGDQIRRQKILAALAGGSKLSRYELASSYASRPLNKFSDDLVRTELIGGWGAVCLMPDSIAGSQRQWSCDARKNLHCAQVFKSANAPGMGICVPNGHPQVGDPLQTGDISTRRFGDDRYLRSSPARIGDWADFLHRDTRIPEAALPQDPPAGNGYYGAHQEYYEGTASGGDGPKAERFRVKRDAQTGGFPGGMLRLSECKGLPGESTCGLVASSGFNDCLALIGDHKKTLVQCFRETTSYSGMRACDARRPCRDDYICLKPMGYNRANAHERHVERGKHVRYDPDDFGQAEPDEAWLSRNGGAGDPAGVCIPPYFVFQFRSDGHPAPMSRELRSPAQR